MYFLKKCLIALMLLLAGICFVSADGFETVCHTDEFGDEIEGSYFVWSIVEDGAMANSATSNDSAALILKFENPDFIVVNCYPYNLGNGADEFYIDDYVTYSFKDDKGRRLSISQSTELSPNTLYGIDAIAVREMMLNSEYVKISVSGDRSRYIYTVDTSNLSEAFTDYADKKDLEETDRKAIFDIEFALSEYVFENVLSEMNPYNKDSEYYDDEVDSRYVSYLLEEIREKLPDYYDIVMSFFQSMTVSEWIDSFSNFYGVDITRTKNMDEVYELFAILEIPFDEEKKTSSESGESIWESTTPSIAKATLMSEGEEIRKEKTRRRFAGRVSTYGYIRTYGIGLDTRIGSDSTENNFSYGLAGGYGVSMGSGNPHFMFNDFAWLYDGRNHSMEDVIYYGYRKPIGMDMDMIMKVGFDFVLKNASCITSFTSLYEDGITDEMFLYIGGSIGLQFMYFFDSTMFMTFGFNDRLLGPGISLLDYEEINAGPENLIEGFIGIGWGL